MQKRLVILSGAGMSAESGIKTFRDADGLWEGRDVMEVASPEGWQRNKALVLDFYNQRRNQLRTVEPNKGHQILAELQNHFKVNIITQNVDDLHERAGSNEVLHLHGELFKVRSEINENLVLDWREDLNEDDQNDLGHSLRPHIVWFGEQVPELERAIPIVEKANIVIVIGTSLQVYPAASLLDFTPENALLYYIDPKPAVTRFFNRQIQVIPEMASVGLQSLYQTLVEQEDSL